MDDSARVQVTPGTNGVITLIRTDGKSVRIFTLIREQAERSCKQILWRAERLVISDAMLVAEGGHCQAYSIGQEEISLSVYPAVKGRLTTPAGVVAESPDGYFTRYILSVPKKEAAVSVEMIAAGQAVVRFKADVFEGVNNVFMLIEYVGDMGSAFLDGKLI